MKKLVILILLCTLFISCHKRTSYCGHVIKMYDGVSNGKYFHSEKHVIFYSVSLKKNIDIEVTDNTYANIKDGELVCFNLLEYQVQ